MPHLNYDCTTLYPESATTVTRKCYWVKLFLDILWNRRNSLKQSDCCVTTGRKCAISDIRGNVVKKKLESGMSPVCASINIIPAQLRIKHNTSHNRESKTGYYLEGKKFRLGKRLLSL